MKILIFTSIYLPGVKAGGPIRSVSNLVEILAGEGLEFYIITSDHDLGSTEPYTNIVTNQWISVGKAKVQYLSKDKINASNYIRLIKEINPTTIYLNGLFNFYFTFLVLFLVRLGFLNDYKIILAPRGELSCAALNIKKEKKSVFLLVVKLFNFYKGIQWHATAIHEIDDIKNFIPNAKIKMVPNLSLSMKVNNIVENPHLKIVFLSRISKIKNLEFCLNVLKEIKNGKIEFLIYGPIEDEDYWNSCSRIIQDMPSNIVIKYLGMVKSNEVQIVLSQSDLLFLPTLGENFGQVIAESISVGTPVLISNKTPWLNLKEKGLGWDINLDNKDYFVNIIKKMMNKNFHEKYKQRIHILNWAKDNLVGNSTISGYLELFN